MLSIIAKSDISFNGYIFILNVAENIIINCLFFLFYGTIIGMDLGVN